MSSTWISSQAASVVGSYGQDEGGDAAAEVAAKEEGAVFLFSKKMFV